jgi:hypothetical protein
MRAAPKVVAMRSVCGKRKEEGGERLAFRRVLNPTEHCPREDEIRSTFASTTGGVMTKVAGAVTGDLEISTRAEGDAEGVSVRYTGAEEWYTVEGSPISLSGTTPPSPDELGELHQRVLGHLRSPGRVVDGNELPVSLASSHPKDQDLS